jgi:hypothetical protein
MATIANRQARLDPPELLPRTIEVGDKIRLNPKRSSPYLLHYGNHLSDQVWTVIYIDSAVGKKRLYVEGPPSAIFARDALMAYTPQSKDRREQLAKVKKR